VVSGIPARHRRLTLKGWTGHDQRKQSSGYVVVCFPLVGKAMPPQANTQEHRVDSGSKRVVAARLLLAAAEVGLMSRTAPFAHPSVTKRNR